MTLQLLATTRAIRPVVELIPPLSDEFVVYGGADTIERARRWALDNRYLLVGGVPPCAHGLYLMSCPAGGACMDRGWADHINLWISIYDRPTPFLLSAPYGYEAPSEADLRRTREFHQYAKAHGLCVDVDYDRDDWYGRGTLPIRLTVRNQSVVWPLEELAAILLATQPVGWSDEDPAA